MKYILISILFLTTSAQAGLTGFDTSKFNDVINDSLQAEQDLRKSLREDAGFKKAEKRNSRLKEITVSDSREVNVPSQFFKDGKKKSKTADINQEQQDFERLSQEMNEVH